LPEEERDELFSSKIELRRISNDIPMESVQLYHLLPQRSWNLKLNGLKLYLLLKYITTDHDPY
jgi:hypothetical protein